VRNEIHAKIQQPGMSSRIQNEIRFIGGELRPTVRRLIRFWMITAAALGAGPVAAQLPVLGDYSAHDPSTMIKEGSRYYIFRTSQGIMGKTSTDLRNWTNSGRVFPGNPPAWTTNAVPGFTGGFWAPDIVLLNGTYYLYYACSGFGFNISAIGLVTTTNLATGPWTDQGPVIQSNMSNNYNTIDPSILVDTNGTMWMAFGSYWNGIYLVQLDPATGKRIPPISPLTRLAYNSSIEAPCLYQHGGYYYLFVNWNTCCIGIDSTYNIRVGRSTAVAGPYLDRNGVSMVNNGGSMFLESTARFIGPGHVGIMNDNGTNWLTYHYYDGNNHGTPTLGLGQLAWSADGWPVFTNDWSAFYPFNTDAREHLGLYNGTLQNGARITNEAARGPMLQLDGATNYVALPNAVANASTFAAWVKWNGGADWQRIFDFGNGTAKYLFLTPRADSGRLRFAIKNGGAEQTIDAPTALPTNAWCHVAVTLDGLRGVLYQNGLPVATNTSLTIRPWQLLTRSNYVGESQFAVDPTFNGRIGSARIFGRALAAAEIKDLAYAQPALAHRYSFTSNAWDSIGMAHGTLMGNAVITNGALVLNGTTGGYVNLPGGLVSGSSAVTVEFWAAFGANGNGSRVFDFGNLSGASGSQFLFFSPHTETGTHRTEISSGNTVNLDVSGTLDNRTVHVVCIVDPANGCIAIYTNGVLETAVTNTLPALSGVNNSWSFIGRSLFSADAWLNATIDEFRIYDGRLTPEEIATDYQFGPDALALPVMLTQSNSPAGLTLSWPSWAAGFAPETVSTLAPGTNWSAVTPSPALANDRWQLALPDTNRAQFFRLRR
jgi:hypothetical protein